MVMVDEQETRHSALAPPPDTVSGASAQRDPGLHSGPSGPYIGPFVYGGLDGVVTTFAVVSGVMGAALSTSVVLILGLANLFADGISMAVGAYLSSRSEQEYFERERETEAWEIANFPDAERAELHALYRERGFSDPDARRLVEIQTRDPAAWVRAMMVEEHGMLASETHPLARGLVTFAAFVIAGAVPLLGYLLGLIIPAVGDIAYPLSLVLSPLTLFGLGAAKVLVTERGALRSGLQMLLVGGLAAAVAYLVGFMLRGIGAG
jgi:VIT1/CCC1 family predicted Fe2+/Mn2+ transporter